MFMKNMDIEIAKINEVEEASILACNTYLEFNSKVDTKEGRENVLKFMSIDNMRIRYLLDDNLLLIAKENNKIIGIIEIIRKNHISSFFIDKDYIKKGIGKRLFEKAHNILQNNVYTVNSSIYAFEFYKKLGFIPTVENIKIEYGVHFYSMILYI